MARPIRNSAVARGTDNSVNVDLLVYTVPADTVLLLKAVFITDTATQPTHVWVTLFDAFEGGNAYVINQIIPAGQTVQWQGWVALNPTDSIHVFTDTRPVKYWIAGALLPFNPAIQ